MFENCHFLYIELAFALLGKPTPRDALVFVPKGILPDDVNKYEKTIQLKFDQKVPTIAIKQILKAKMNESSDFQ